MIPPEVLDGYRETLEAFVRRARRIEAHSLLEDLGQFVKWAQGSARLVHSGDEAELQHDVPPEEAFESLVARVRPLLLEQDGIHHARVLAAVGAFGRNDSEIMKAKQALTAHWRRLTGSSILGFAVGEAVDGAPLVKDIDLAHGWLYGDLVHADSTLTETVKSTTLNQRFIAATIVYGQAVLGAIGTLNVVRQMVDKGLLELDTESLETPVTTSSPMHFPVAAARIGPASDLTGFGVSIPEDPSASPSSNQGP